MIFWPEIYCALLLFLQSKKLKAIPTADKNEIGRMLAFIETTLGERWNEYEGYKELECRNTNMRRILSAQGNKKDHGQFLLKSKRSIFLILLFKSDFKNSPCVKKETFPFQIQKWLAISNKSWKWLRSYSRNTRCVSAKVFSKTIVIQSTGGRL